MSKVSELNMGLVESFSSLEQICNQIYGENHGVTSYIEEMESLGYSASSREAGFDPNLHALKAVRHKRNMLSHGTSFNTPLAEQEDIDFTNAFRSSILKGTDPLALHQKKALIYVKKRTESKAYNTHGAYKRQGSKQGLGPTLAFIALIIIGIVILLGALGIIK